MNPAVGRAARIAAGITLFALSIAALSAPGAIRWLAAAEAIAATLFCLPRVWRYGGVALLAILALALTHHAMQGQFVASLLFAALVVVMALVHERS